MPDTQSDVSQTLAVLCKPSSDTLVPRSLPCSAKPVLGIPLFRGSFIPPKHTLLPLCSFLRVLFQDRGQLFCRPKHLCFAGLSLSFSWVPRTQSSALFRSLATGLESRAGDPSPGSCRHRLRSVQGCEPRPSNAWRSPAAHRAARASSDSTG